MDNIFGEKSRQNFRIEIENKNTIIKEITDFDLEQTLECGQCFRFYKQDEEDYVVVAQRNQTWRSVGKRNSRR